MDFKDALKNSGLNIPNKPVKVDSKKANMQLKVDRADKILSKLYNLTLALNSTPNTEEFSLVQSSIILYYQRLCDSIKDLLDIIAIKENIQNLSENRGFGELIRRSFNILNIPSKEQDIIKKLTARNDIVHDYINMEYYDEIITVQVMDDIETYKNYFNKIKQYFIDKNMIN